MDKRIKIAAGAGLAALAVAVAGGSYYYFNVRTDTPDYAIKTVSRSIEQHDVKEFHRVVNLDGVLDSGYDGFVDGMTTPGNATTPDAKEAIRNFTQMLRVPLLLSLKVAVDSYVETGDLNATEHVGVMELIERTGLNDIEVRGVHNIELNDANRNEAFADLILYQPELGREFPIKIVLTRGADEQWQITRVQNFQEYVAQITQARQMQFDEYLAKAGEINAKHEITIREAEQKYSAILTQGNLAQEQTRNELKKILNDVVKPDWEMRKQELFSLPVPKGAAPLHDLYMRICDLSIVAAQDYAKWLDDRNVATIKAAENKIHQVQMLMTEAAVLAKRLTS